MQQSNSADIQIGSSIRNAIKKYFATLDGTNASNIYALVLAEIEVPLLQTVMEHAGNNQSKAAAWLGISRNTLRKLLSKYEL